MKNTLLALLLVIVSCISGIFGAFLFSLGFFELQESSHPGGTSEINQSFSQGEKNNNAPVLSNLQTEITQTVEKVSESIVSIVISKDLVVYRSDPWGFFQQPTGTVQRKVGGGSGFFVKKDGTILTNKHVVSDMSAQYTVILSDGSEYPAQVLATDPVNDLAVIKINDTTQKDFQVLPLIANTDTIQIGAFAIAVGNALAEFQNSVSLGIVSGKDRSIEASGESLTGLIQTDAAINPGNSGGPLINLEGEVIGINTAIVSGSNGIGFSIALTQDKLDYMLTSIAESGRIKRPFIGINYIPNSVGIAAELGLATDVGVYIVDETESIVAGSSAEKSGLKPGDIITKINGKILNTGNTLQNIIQNSIPGTSLKITILRKDEEEKELELILGEY